MQWSVSQQEDDGETDWNCVQHGDRASYTLYETVTWEQAKYRKREKCMT